MKNKNKIGVILASVLVLVSSCTKEPDMTYMDKWLGEDFNQELLWNLDSLAFRRAKWTVESVAEGVQMRQTQVKMMGAVRSISCISYSPDEFKTFVAYSETSGTVDELASAQEKALFAISGVNVNAADYIRYAGNVVNNSTSDPSQVNGVLAISSSLSTNVFSLYNCADGNYGSVAEDNAFATGAVLVSGGKEQTFPSGDYYEKRMARSIIGIDDNTGNYVFATIDKGLEGQADGATIAEAAFIARLLGMNEAICLADGDGAALWAKEAGVLNEPSAADAKLSAVVYVGTNEPTLDGEGTEASPYIIDMAVKMKQMRKYAPVGGETWFKLTKDINMSTVKTWFPVNWDGEFNRKIHFDGNGKTITNFSPNAFTDNVNTSQDASYPSLFGVLYGSCKDLTVKGSVFNIGTKNGVGIIGGYIGTTGKPAVVENVHLVDCEINGTGNTYGGIGGNGREATIRNCSVDIVIRAGGTDVGGMIGVGNGTVVIEDSKAEVDLAPQTNPGSNMRYGAILGYHKGTALTINNCQTSGVISCGYSCNCSGGIVAYSGSTSSTNIAQCKSAVAIKNDSGKQLSNSGGIVGCHGSAGTCTIADCYSIGDMEVRQTSGGLVGRHEKGTLSITDSYSTSSLNGYSGLGSILGQSASAGTLILTDCIAWASSINANRDGNDKYSSGAIVGAASGKSTITNCVRRSDMAFKDPYRTLTEHGNLNGVVHSGAANQQAYDGRPTSESTVSAAAKAAGWSETVWDLTGDLPELKIFK